ncbi:redox-active disulfide protein 2 [Pedobacter nototheniae]|uniref:redox-active disulfide protein 2 n=1 Tax=Pedobacter nototheniae TaxID=2488994 RepID=UPI001039EBAF|nr:redox-active disulfide protein 2 [Pedobacter nototheniae]
MTDNKLAGISNEELIKNEKKAKGLTLVFTGVLIVLFTVNTITCLKNGFSAVTIVPIALLPVLIININSWKELKKEIKRRDL